jgi:hypothetical protein
MQMNELPSIEEVVVQTTAVLINLAAKALDENRPAEAKQGIDAARALVPLCPEDVARQLRDPLAQLQMEYVRAQGAPGEGPAAGPPPAEPPPAERPPPKIWTPPGR